MASCCRKARFSRAKLHRPLSVALNKQNSKDSNSPIPVECRARLQKVNDINCYEVLAKDRADKISIMSGNFSGSNRLRRQRGARTVTYHGLWPLGEVQYDVHQTPSHGNPDRENHMQHSHLEESSCKGRWSLPDG